MGVIRRKALIKADKALSKEVSRQYDIIVPAACLALHRHDGWKKQRLKKMIDISKGCWDECGADPDLSILLMVENEIGIEMQNGNGVSYHDLHYLKGKSSLKLEDMTAQQYVMMRIRQREWIGTLVMGAILLAMHRKEGYGPARCARLMGQVQEIASQYNYDPKTLKHQMAIETLLMLV